MENIAAASRKRKLRHDQAEEDNEEEKMEEFYALVKNLREARDRLMRGSNATNETENNRLTKKSKLGENKPVEVWKPTFQREDFLEEIGELKNPHHPVTTVAAGSSQIKEGTGKEEIKEGLDLTLSL